jgi:putative DNA primase/helicase
MSDSVKKDMVDLLDQELNRFKKSSEQKSAASTSKVKLKHSEVPEYIYNRLEEVNFAKEAAITKLGEGLTRRHYICTCTEKIIEIVDSLGFGLCYRNGQIYLYNGEYWRKFPLFLLQNFMGKTAVKMGVDRFTGEHYTFKEQLAKQFMSCAYVDNDFEERNESFDKALINLKNGTFELSSQGLRLREPDKNDFLTYQLDFDYDEKAECPLFKEFLDRVLPDKTLQAILAEYIGYIFIKTEDLKLEKALLLYGTGANGKSVVFEVIYALLGGKENVCNFSLENLTSANGYHRAMLGGKLLNYATEISSKINESIFKQLASGEPVEARVPYGDPFTLTNYGKMIFNCNLLPRTGDHSEAFYRRFIIIPFDVTIPEKEQDKQLANKIISNELPGVLNWVLVFPANSSKATTSQ